MITTFITSLLVLLMIHYLCDFALQNDFVAKFKFPIVDGKPNPIWFHCLIAHCAIHALGVYVFTQSISLALLMFGTHFSIDRAKCLNKLTFNQDQFLHGLVVLIIAIIYTLFEFSN